MKGRARLFLCAPWLRAPVLAFRSPALFAGVGVAGVVLGLAAGSRPVFISSATSGALQQDLTNGCAYDVGLRVVRRVAVPGSPAVAAASTRLPRSGSVAPTPT